MIKRTTFENIYPVLIDYITDPDKRYRLLNNEDFKKKYQNNENSICYFIKELEINFSDKEVIKSIIDETIIRMPENVLISFITSYLNSLDEDKKSIDVVDKYNKILTLGVDCIKYVEINGIVTDFASLPSIIIEKRFEKLNTNNYEFHGTYLNDIFNELSNEEKEFINLLLEEKEFETFQALFNESNFSLIKLIK